MRLDGTPGKPGFFADVWASSDFASQNRDQSARSRKKMCPADQYD
jgi:hypothetical protein